MSLPFLKCEGDYYIHEEIKTFCDRPIFTSDTSIEGDRKIEKVAKINWLGKKSGDLCGSLGINTQVY